MTRKDAETDVEVKNYQGLNETDVAVTPHSSAPGRWWRGRLTPCCTTWGPWQLYASVSMSFHREMLLYVHVDPRYGDQTGEKYFHN